jgi:hypothetical protein
MAREPHTAFVGNVGDSVTASETRVEVDAVLARLDVLREVFFRDPEQSAYAVLDGAMIPGLPNRLAESPETSACLYRGELGLDLKMTAPYLVKLDPEGPLFPWIFGEGWGKSWGIVVVTPLAFDALRRHFRGFLRVRDYTGKVLYFRWYDPRVLRVYLPTCNAGEIKTVFGAISRFLCEGEDAGEMIEYPHHRVRLVPRTRVF